MDLHFPSFADQPPGQVGAKFILGTFQPLGAKSPSPREFEGLPVWVKEQNIGSVDAQLTGDLVQYNSQHNVHIKTAADGHVDRTHRDQALHAPFGALVQPG